MIKELPIVPSAKKGSLAEISVASYWREYRPEIREPNKVNQVIVYFCPDGAIIKKNDTIEIDLCFCKGCGICAAESDGIAMVPEYTGEFGIFGAKEDN